MTTCPAFQLFHHIPLGNQQGSAGNINVLVFRVPEMAERLAATGGIVPEFVNPKWADTEWPGPVAPAVHAMGSLGNTGNTGNTNGSYGILWENADTCGKIFGKSRINGFEWLRTATCLCVFVMECLGCP